MISIVFLLLIALFMYLMTLVVENLWFLPLWFALGVIVASIGVVIFVVIQFPIFKHSKFTNKYKYYVCRSTSHWLIVFFLRLRIQITGKENIPNDGGPLTVFANHKSYADPFIIFEIMKRPTTFTPKMSVYKLFLVGKLLKYLGAFPIDRSSDRNTARAMVDAIKVIKDGMAMAIFPEGGIKDRNDEKMVAMRAGAYRVAMKAGADLLPVSIQNTTSIKYRAPFRSTKIFVVIHPVVRYADVKHLTTLEVADKMFNIINNKLEN